LYSSRLSLRAFISLNTFRRIFNETRSIDIRFSSNIILVFN
jgi:hypothetical protein